MPDQHLQIPAAKEQTELSPSLRICPVDSSAVKQNGHVGNFQSCLCWNKARGEFQTVFQFFDDFRFFCFAAFQFNWSGYQVVFGSIPIEEEPVTPLFIRGMRVKFTLNMHHDSSCRDAVHVNCASFAAARMDKVLAIHPCADLVKNLTYVQIDCRLSFLPAGFGALPPDCRVLQPHPSIREVLSRLRGYT